MDIGQWIRLRRILIPYSCAFAHVKRKQKTNGKRKKVGEKKIKTRKEKEERKEKKRNAKSQKGGKRQYLRFRASKNLR